MIFYAINYGAQDASYGPCLVQIKCTLYKVDL